MRLFVAVDPSATAAEHLGTVVDTLEVARANQPGRSTRVADRSQWHVTLAFLGEVAPERLERASGALERATHSIVEPIVLRVAGGGTFGRGRFTILWAALDGDVAGLRSLATAVRTQLRRARLRFDPKPLRPHLTLAHPGDRVTREQVRADVATLNEYRGPEWTVDAVHLVRSEMVQTPTGPRPRYTRLSSATLPGTGSSPPPSPPPVEGPDA